MLSQEINFAAQMVRSQNKRHGFTFHRGLFSSKRYIRLPSSGKNFWGESEAVEGVCYKIR